MNTYTLQDLKNIWEAKQHLPWERFLRFMRQTIFLVKLYGQKQFT